MISTAIVSAVLVAPTEGGQGWLPMLIMWGGIAAVFWFVLIRPQRKAQQEHEEMLEKLERGDEVMTDGGIMGELIHLDGNELTLRTGENTRLVVARAKIARLLTGPKETEE